MVERQPSKLNVVGSRPITRSIAAIAQLVEQLICNQQVVGSSPIAGSILWRNVMGFFGTFFTVLLAHFVYDFIVANSVRDY